MSDQRNSRTCRSGSQDWTISAGSALKTLTGKWKIILICEMFMANGPARFSHLERRIPTINQKMLAQQLRELERDGLVARRAYPEVPPRVEYSLTELGHALAPAMEALIDWAFMHQSMRGSTAGNSGGDRSGQPV